MSTQIDIVNQQLEVALSERPIINIDHITTEINLNNTSNNINLETNTQYIDVNILNDTIIDVALWNGISVYEDSSLIGSTRAIDFISGNNITLSTQKLSNKVLVTINSSGGGGGSGDVVGPSSAVDSNFASFNTTTGKLIKDSGYNSLSFDASGSAAAAQAAAIQRANHTGTQLASTISDFNSAALAAAPAETVNTIGSLINGSSAATPNDTDLVATADTSVLKKITWTNVKAFLKTYFDTLYQAILVSGTNIKTINGSSVLGSGNLTVSGGPGGSDTQVQFNDSGVFGGDANFTFNKTTNRLTVDYVTVNDDAYDATSWNANNDVPTKNSVRDKVENLQPLDATLTALAGLATGANKIPYSTGTDTFSQLDFKDEDDMASNSATALPSQQSVKAYVDAAQGVWRSLPTMTRTDGDTFTIPDTGNAGNWDKKLDRLTVIKWTDTTVHMAIVKSSSYSSNVVTVEIAGDTLDNTFTTTSGYYTIIPAEKVTFAIAGTIATGTDLSRKWYADKAYRVLLGKANHGTAGTTNATTYDINKNGSTMFTTKLSVSSADTTGDDTTANDNTSLANEDYVTLDCDSVSTTAPIDAYIDLYLFPTNKVFL